MPSPIPHQHFRLKWIAKTREGVGLVTKPGGKTRCAMQFGVNLNKGQSFSSANSSSPLQLLPPSLPPPPPRRKRYSHIVQSSTGVGTVEAAEHTTAPYNYTRTRASPLIISVRIPQHRQSQKITHAPQPAPPRRVGQTQ